MTDGEPGEPGVPGEEPAARPVATVSLHVVMPKGKFPVSVIDAVPAAPVVLVGVPIAWVTQPFSENVASSNPETPFPKASDALMTTGCAKLVSSTVDWPAPLTTATLVTGPAVTVRLTTAGSVGPFAFEAEASNFSVPAEVFAAGVKVSVPPGPVVAGVASPPAIPAPPTESAVDRFTTAPSIPSPKGLRTRTVTAGKYVPAAVDTSALETSSTFVGVLAKMTRAASPKVNVLVQRPPLQNRTCVESRAAGEFATQRVPALTMLQEDSEVNLRALFRSACV